MSHFVGVFISHSWAYTNHYDRLAEWIFNEPGGWNYNGVPVIFRDYSIPENNPIHNAPNQHLLRQAIYTEIQKSNVIICPTGMYANYSKWIRKELEGAKAYGRKILAVNPWAQQRMSSTVQNYSDDTVGWTKKSVVNGIWGLYWDQING